MTFFLKIDLSFCFTRSEHFYKGALTIGKLSHPSVEMASLHSCASPCSCISASVILWDSEVLGSREEHRPREASSQVELVAGAAAISQ